MIAAKIIELVAKNAEKIVAGVAVGAAGALGGYAVAKVKDDKEFQKRAEDIYESGVKKGTKLAALKARKTFVDPVIAQVAMAYYIAWADGKLTRAEKKELDSLTKSILDNPKLPPAVVAEIKKITEEEPLSFDTVRKYLDKASEDSLLMFADEIDKLSDSKSYKEEAAVEKYHRYLIDRMGESKKSISSQELKEIAILSQKKSEESIEEYFDHFVEEEKIRVARQEFSLKMKLLDQSFKSKTKLDAKDISLLMIAICLQCARIYLVEKFTKIETANHGKREDLLHRAQGKVLKVFGDGKNEISRPYYASLDDIIATRGVPYDATTYERENLKIFSGHDGKKGVNHRFASIGHDPLLGLVVGTVNIMTNTITTTKSRAYAPETYHVRYAGGISSPMISERASFSVAFAKSIERSEKDLKPLAASFIKQLIHTATDMYTPKGISLPGANLILDRTSVEKLTDYVSYGDMVKISVSAGLSSFINKLIELIHGAMLMDNDENLDNELNRVKTKKLSCIQIQLPLGVT